MQSKNFIDFIVDAGLDNPDLAKEFAKQMRGVQSEKETPDVSGNQRLHSEPR